MKMVEGLEPSEGEPIQSSRDEGRASPRPAPQKGVCSQGAQRESEEQQDVGGQDRVPGQQPRRRKPRDVAEEVF